MTVVGMVGMVILAVSLLASAQTSGSAAQSSNAPNATDEWIASAQKKIASGSAATPAQATPAASLAAAKAYASYDDLGQAYFQKARETGDATFYQLAEATLAKALELAPDDAASAQPAVHMALVYMGEHRFRDALDYANRSLVGGTTTPEAFALIGDANADLGRYADAEAAYTSMVAIGGLSRSPIQLAYMHDSRLSYLKFIHGDSTAAIALMKSAIWAAIQSRVPPENLAWLYFELGERYFYSGDLLDAEAAYSAGIAVDSNHYRALAGLAKVRTAQHRYPESIDLYQRSLAVVPMPAYLADLGDVYLLAHQPEQARQQFDLVETIAYLNNINKVLNGRELAQYYADHDVKLSQALALAREELALRQDVVTWDILAWVLYKNHQLPEAAEAMHHALAFGTQDAMFLFHAGMIERALGHADVARAHFTAALKINPYFHTRFPAEAEQALLELNHAEMNNTDAQTAATSPGSVPVGSVPAQAVSAEVAPATNPKMANRKP